MVEGLVQRGLSIAIEGEAPAGLAFAASQSVADEAWCYAQARRVPLVVYLWDLPPWRLEGGQPDLTAFVAGRFLQLPIPGRRYPERPRYYSRLRYILRHAAEVWTPSVGSADLAARFFSVNARQVIPWYDSERFVPDTRVVRSSAIVSVSRLVPSKNQAALLRGAALVTPRRPVRLIGRGPEAAALARLATELGVECTIEQEVTDAGVVQAYREAGVVVSASRFEGFGLTPMEAIGCGAPTVVSDLPVHREFLREVPHYFPLDDDRALADAVAAAAGRLPDPEVLRDRLGLAAAADRYTERFRALFGQFG